MTCAEIRCTRRVNSAAARRENVSRRIRRESAPLTIRKGYPMRESVSLAGARTGNDEQGPGTAFASNAMLYCLALLPIEFSWAASGDRHGRIGSWKMSPESMFSFCSQHFGRWNALGWRIRGVPWAPSGSRRRDEQQGLIVLWAVHPCRN